MEINSTQLNIANNYQKPCSSGAEREKIMQSNNQQSIPVYNKTQDSERTREIFKTYNLLNKPIGYREIETFNAPYIGESKLYELNNGHKVVVIPRPGMTLIKTFVNAGANNESIKNSGISHFIEHNIFNGSEKYKTGEFDKILKKTGTTYNAGTSLYNTIYYINFASQDKYGLENLVALYADTIQNPTFPPAMIDKEKNIVLKETFNDSRDSIYKDILIRTLFKLDNVKNIIGESKTIKNFTRQDMLDYYNIWYTPDNMTTVVIGEVYPPDVINIFSKYFNKRIDKKVLSEKKYYPHFNENIQQTKRFDIESNDNKVNLYMAFIGPKNDNIKDKIANSILLNIIEDHMKAKFDYDMSANTSDIKTSTSTISSYKYDPKVNLINANFKPGFEEQGLKSIYSVINKMTQESVSDKELQYVKNQLKRAYNLSYEYPKYISDNIAESLKNYGDLKYYTNFKELISTITPEDIQNAAKQFMDLNKTAIIMEHPKDQYKKLVAKESTNNVRFTGDLNRINFNHTKEYVLQNNLHLVIDSTPGIVTGVIDIHLSTNNMQNAAPGTYEILEFMLKSKLKEYNNPKINQYDVDPSIKIIASGIFSMSHCEPEKLPEAINSLKNLILNPDFSNENFFKAKNAAKFKYSSNRDKLDEKFNKELFGDHPYGNTSKEILNNLDNITLQDIINLYNNIISNAYGNAVISIPDKNLTKINDKIIKSLNIGFPNLKKYQLDNSYNFQPLTNNKIFISPEESDFVYIKKAFIINENGNVKDKMTINLLNIILGDDGFSRIFQDLREKQYLAYAIKSHYRSQNNVGYLDLELVTSTEDKTNIKKSIDSLNNHINKLINTPVSQDELNDVKLTLKNKIYYNFDTSTRISGIIESMNTPYGINYANDKLKAIDSITPQDIQKAAILYLNKPSITMIGANKETLEQNRGYLSTLGQIEEIH